VDHQVGHAQQADGGPQARSDGVELREPLRRSRPVPARLDRGGGVTADVQPVDEGVDERS